MRKLAIFELDGVLVDRAGLAVAVIEEAYDALELPAPSSEILRELAAAPLAKALVHLGELHEPSVVWQWRAAHARALSRRRTVGDVDVMRPGALELLDRLKSSGWDVGLATRRTRVEVSSFFLFHDISDKVSLVSCDGEVRGARPSPRIVQSLMRMAEAAPQATAVISDSPLDMTMARRAEAHAIGVSWGESSGTDLCAAGAHEVAHGYSSLYLLLESLNWSRLRSPAPATAATPRRTRKRAEIS